MSGDILAAAHTYGRRGWRVVPLHHITGEGACSCQRATCGGPGKHPIRTDWPERASASGADVEAWWEDRPSANVGIATGAASGIWVLDVDPDNGGISSLQSLVADHDVMPATRVHQTGSGGLHYLFTWPGFDVRNSSSWLGPGLDVRGTGGQIVAPPSVSSKGLYVVVSDIEPGPAPGWLLEMVREHSERAAAGKRQDVAPPQPVDIEWMPPEVRHLAAELVGEDEGRFRHFHALTAACRRAGYTQGQTVTIVTPWCEAVGKFVGRVPQEVARCWGKLEDEAARAEQWMPGITGTGGTILAPIPDPQPGQTDPDPDKPTAPDHTSWWPRDLAAIAAGDHTDPAPTRLTRTDNVPLLYPGKTNALIGESESGKTWIALLAVAQAIGSGQSVVYLDFEDTASGILTRLDNLGIPADLAASQLAYISPDEPLTVPASADFAAALEQTRPDLIVLDGVNAAMTMLGFDLDKNKDVTTFSQLVLRRLKTTGAAVLTVDHVTKAKEGRGNYAIGAQAKRADIDGAAFLVEVTRPFGKGMTGKLRLTVSKDRPGAVRAMSAAAKHVGNFILESEALTGAVNAYIEPPRNVTEDGEAFRPTALMERVSHFLSTIPDGATKSAIEKEVEGRGNYIRLAVDVLVEEGYITRETGPRGSIVHKNVRLYRPAAEPSEEEDD